MLVLALFVFKLFVIYIRLHSRQHSMAFCSDFKTGLLDIAIAKLIFASDTVISLLLAIPIARYVSTPYFEPSPSQHPIIYPHNLPKPGNNLPINAIYVLTFCPLFIKLFVLLISILSFINLAATIGLSILV